MTDDGIRMIKAVRDGDYVSIMPLIDYLEERGDLRANIIRTIVRGVYNKMKQFEREELPGQYLRNCAGAEVNDLGRMVADQFSMELDLAEVGGTYAVALERLQDMARMYKAREGPFAPEDVAGGAYELETTEYDTAAQLIATEEYLNDQSMDDYLASLPYSEIRAHGTSIVASSGHIDETVLMDLQAYHSISNVETARQSIYEDEQAREASAQQEDDWRLRDNSEVI